MSSEPVRLNNILMHQRYTPAVCCSFIKSTLYFGIFIKPARFQLSIYILSLRTYSSKSSKSTKNITLSDILITENSDTCLDPLVSPSTCSLKHRTVLRIKHPKQRNDVKRRFSETALFKQHKVNNQSELVV